MTLDDLGDKLFADVPEVANITGRDARTIRAAIEAGQIPATKLGRQYAIPTAWLREQIDQATPVGAEGAPDFDGLAEAVADRVLARIAQFFGGFSSMTAGNAP